MRHSVRIEMLSENWDVENWHIQWEFRHRWDIEREKTMQHHCTTDFWQCAPVDAPVWQCAPVDAPVCPVDAPVWQCAPVDAPVCHINVHLQGTLTVCTCGCPAHLQGTPKCPRWTWCMRYGVATTSRRLEIIGLFCKRALKKETYLFKEPTSRSHW